MNEKLDSLVKKDTPAQQRERLQWQLDTIRENQESVTALLNAVMAGEYRGAKAVLTAMHKQDRDALLQIGGIFSPDQIAKLLKG